MAREFAKKFYNSKAWRKCRATYIEHRVVGMVDANKQPIARVNYGINGKPERTLLGRKVVLNEYMTSLGATISADTVVAFLFDWSDYMYNTNYAMTVKNYEDNDTEDQITKAVMICDGKVIDNRNYYAVEICHSTGDSAKFTQSEKNAAYYIACKLKEHGWGIDKVKKHQDFSGKYCPHKTLDLGWERFLNLIRNNLKHSTETENSYIYPDGNWGEKTTRITQKVLGTTVDGIVSRQPKVNRTFLPSAFTSSWMFYINSSNYKNGSAMIKALQELIGAKADGWFGKESVKAMQNFLRAKGLFDGVVDGIMGPKTVRAWQQYINSRL